MISLRANADRNVLSTEAYEVINDKMMRFGMKVIHTNGKDQSNQAPNFEVS